MKQLATIYGLRERGSRVIRYIGRTIGPPNKRRSQHVSSPLGQKIAQWIESVDRSNVIVEVLERCSCPNFETHERRWITEYQWRYPSLCNGTSYVFGGTRTSHGRPLASCSVCGKSQWYRWIDIRND